ncbi:MAG: trimethylamine methyltransferase family protein, partial [Dethiobacteria bacterium]|nr:trimethylamine methyltransferase family protein [Dethiobacteria bacterium]
FLESGMSASQQGLVMGDEIISYVRKMLQGIRGDDETLAVDVIDAVGPGGHFLQEEHTFRNFKSAFWMPKLINREQYTSWEANGKITYDQRLTARTEEILVSHKPEPLDAGLKAEFDKIVARAEARVG